MRKLFRELFRETRKLFPVRPKTRGRKTRRERGLVQAPVPLLRRAPRHVPADTASRPESRGDGITSRVASPSAQYHAPSHVP